MPQWTTEVILVLKVGQGKVYKSIWIQMIISSVCLGGGPLK